MFSSVEAAFYRSLLLFLKIFSIIFLNVYAGFSDIHKSFYLFFHINSCYIKINIYICKVINNEKNRNYETYK